MSTSVTADSVELHVTNVGGIDATDVQFEHGITILSGRNATNRTSLLQALMVALGSDSASLKADADEGRVELEIGDDTYVRTLERAGDGVRLSGEPYLDSSELADLFAFLLESNEARRAVATQDDLREILLRPVDTDEIEREIRQLTDEKREITDEIERLDSLKRELPTIEQERTEIETEIEDKRAELETVQDEIEAAERTVTEPTPEKAKLEEALSELSERRSAVEDVQFDIETERESLEALRDEVEQFETERRELPDADPGAADAIDDEIDTLQSRARSLERAVRQLQDIVQFNEEMLEGTHPEVRAALSEDRETDGSLTDRLLNDDDSVHCWTCGSVVDREQIESTIGRMRSLHSSKFSEQNELEERIAELRSERRELESVRERRDAIQERLTSLESEIEMRQERLTDLEDQLSALEAEVERTETTVEELEAAVEEATPSQDGPSVVELNKRANDLEFALGRLERERETTVERISEIETELERKAQLEDRRETVRAELEDLRTRIERIEREMVTSFNDHMETILEILDYENIDRIWLERVERSVREGRRTVDRATFTLHVVRSSEDGRTYEDTIAHLSESEREVTGLIFALAGYLVHDVYDVLPFMVLDSLESLDADRVASLVEYFGEYTEFLVVALLPEDARALPDRHDRIRRI